MTGKWSKKSWTGESSAFYQTTKWKNFRKKIIEETPLCELCSQYGFVNAGKIADHIIPRSICEDLEYEVDNIQILCEDFEGGTNCHSQKTAQSRNIKLIESFIDEMENGKLQYICTEKKKKKLFELLKEKGLK
ncbi:hypothetical protein P872_14095 [Rhodonellum psychrophilum GCM71 = DSM 17998]|uniref:HNH domain-containing protein n=2 Tax=Rhodonellum TaxID=336827 RepID=U5BUF3_9BACT|nr:MULTISPECIES: HNH endonuclease signature motif containing protein [Rhodonellum]ERM80216.1 hypothetical protein P872_14095 [Rhodonellum psychrophilum GCM71 = DSM 17998]SDZ35802.1 HNH endonuclease [Rhodonellum ikkaensis]